MDAWFAGLGGIIDLGNDTYVIHANSRVGVDVLRDVSIDKGGWECIPYVEMSDDAPPTAGNPATPPTGGDAGPEYGGRTPPAFGGTPGYEDGWPAAALGGDWPPVSPADSPFWQSLERTRRRGIRTDGKYFYTYDYGTRHSSHIEKWNKRGKHMGIYNSRGQKVGGAERGKRIDL